MSSSREWCLPHPVLCSLSCQSCYLLSCYLGSQSSSHRMNNNSSNFTVIQVVKQSICASNNDISWRNRNCEYLATLIPKVCSVWDTNKLPFLQVSICLFIQGNISILLLCGVNVIRLQFKETKSHWYAAIGKRNEKFINFLFITVFRLLARNRNRNKKSISWK